MDHIPTPQEFADQMKDASTLDDELEDYGDYEDTHYRMDNLMCDLLQMLGYGNAVDIFKQSPKWYA